MFVSSIEYRRSMRGVVLSSKHLRLAVAFWGNHGEKLVGGRRGQKRQIICNLRHGGTNPAVIKKLLRTSNVRQHDHLHAKVVLGDNAAVVGSANISANGLGLEGAEIAGWEEAGLVTRDAGMLRQIDGWFRRLWRESRDITGRDLKIAQERWASRQHDRSIVMPRGVRRDNPRAPSDAAFENRAVALIVHRDFAREEAEEAAAALATAASAGHKPRLSNLTWYEQWSWLPRTGAVISLIWHRSGRLEFNGVYEFLGQTSYRDGRATVPVTVYRGIGAVLGRRFTESVGRSFVGVLKPRIRAMWRAGRGDSAGKVITLAAALRKCPEAKRFWATS